LQAIAEPGGIYISRQAHDHLLEKLALTFERLGPRHFKNITRPIEVYSVNFDSVGMTQEIAYCRAADGAACLCPSRRGAASGQDSELDEPSRIRLAEPSLAPLIGRFSAELHVYPLRRTRQRFVRLGC